LLREIFILRKLSEMEENIFSVKLLDVILPKQFESIESTQISATQNDGVQRMSTDELPTMQNMMQITYIFVVMENV